MRTRGLLVMLAACGGGSTAPDAARSPDAATTPDATGLIDSMPPPACNALAPGGTHVVFLDFDGVTLTSGADDDATNNVASIVVTSPATFPAWHAADASRDLAIAAMQCQVRQALDAFDIDVVTTRPASGTYQMIVIGGDASNLGFPTGEQGGASSDCGDANHVNVAWVAETAEGVTTPDTEIANFALGAIGVEIGLDGDGTVGDCLCGWGDPNCVQSTTDLCAYHDGVPDTAPNCMVGGNQDERLQLTASYGARP